MDPQIFPRKIPNLLWLSLSAIFLGITAASKYTYCIVGIAILVDWLWSTRPDDLRFNLKSWLQWLAPVLAWGILSIAIFFLANPYLWSHPLNRLKESLLFHGAYTQSETMRRAALPPWQPLVWLFGSVPWHPNVFPFSIDLYITLLAAFGIRRLWQRNRMIAPRMHARSNSFSLSGESSTAITRRSTQRRLSHPGARCSTTER